MKDKNKNYLNYLRKYWEAQTDMWAILQPYMDSIKNPKTDIVYKFPIKTADELIWNKHMEKRDKYLDFLNDMGEGEAIKKTSLQEMMLDRDILKSQQTYYSVEIDKTKEK